MKKTGVLPAAALAGGLAGFALRLGQNRTGYDPATGLPIPGNLCAALLILVLAVLAGALLFLSRPFPARLPPDCPFRRALRAGPVPGALLAGGQALWLAGGGWELLAGLNAPLPAPGPFGGRGQILLGALTILSALALVPAVQSAASGQLDAEMRPLRPGFLLVPLAMLLFRLIAAYRAESVSPVLAAYALRLLALAALTMGFSRLASFAYGDGRPRQYACLSGLSLVLCMTVAADGSSALFFLGGGAILAGFLLSIQPAADAV